MRKERSLSSREMFILIAGDIDVGGLCCPGKRKKSIERSKLSLIGDAPFILAKTINFFYEAEAFLWREQF